MTDYFDSAVREVRQGIAQAEMLNPSKMAQEPHEVVRAAAVVEGRVVRDVLLCTGDREFPNDLREKVLSTLTLKALVDYGGHLRVGVNRNEDAEDYLVTCRESELLGDLHSLFHELARRKVQTRFGGWSDSPAGNLSRRDSHDAGGGDG